MLGYISAPPILQMGRWRLGEPRFRILFLAGLAVALCRARWLPRSVTEALMASLPRRELLTVLRAVALPCALALTECPKGAKSSRVE